MTPVPFAVRAIARARVANVVAAKKNARTPKRRQSRPMKPYRGAVPCEHVPFDEKNAGVPMNVWGNDKKLDLRVPSVACFTDASLKNSTGAIAVSCPILGQFAHRIGPGSGATRPDINDLELLAVYAALRIVDPSVNVYVYSDSETALVNVVCAPTYRYGYLASRIADVASRRLGATLFCKVKAHSGNAGNERADELAGRLTKTSDPTTHFESIQDFLERYEFPCLIGRRQRSD